MRIHLGHESTIIHPDHHPPSTTMKATLILALIAIAAQTVVSLPGDHPHHHPHHHVKPGTTRIERAGNGVDNGNKSGSGNFLSGGSQNGIGSLNGLENRLGAVFQADEVAEEGNINKGHFSDDKF
jgi:hypothetical protein